MTTQLWSINALARETGLDRRTVADRLQDTPPDGKLGRHPAWLLRTALAAITRRVEIAGARLDAEQERAALFREQRRRVEHQNKVAEGEYVKAADVLAADAAIFTALRDRIRAVKHCAPLLVQAALQEGELEVQRLLGAALDAALEEVGTAKLVAAPRN